MKKPVIEKGGLLVYKCRRCGKLVKDTHVPDVMTFTTCMLHRLPLPKEYITYYPDLIESHLCDDKQIGITDWIGVEYDKEKE